MKGNGLGFIIGLLALIALIFVLFPAIDPDSGEITGVLSQFVDEEDLFNIPFGYEISSAARAKGFLINGETEGATYLFRRSISYSEGIVFFLLVISILVYIDSLIFSTVIGMKKEMAVKGFFLGLILGFLGFLIMVFTKPKE